MKNRFFARSCLLIGIVVGLWMCSKEPTVTPIGSKEPLYSVAKARAYYDGASCTTRTIAEPGPLTPGDYSLDWDQAEVSLDSLLSSVDVPINMQYRYFRYLQPESDSVELVPIYSKLVVVKEHPTLLEGCYIRHLMPARSMIRAYPDYDYDALLNSRPKTDFSGVSLYTDLNGWPMCICYYYGGELLVDAFLFDRAYSLEENIARLCDLLGDLAVARCTKAETRATETNQDDQKPIVIDEVVVSETWQDVFDRLLTQLDLQNSYMHDLPNPGIGGSGEGPTNGGGSGSSSSGNSNDGDGEDSSSEPNENIKYEDEETKELIEPLLDSISQDCMGKTLLDALDGVTIKIGADHNGYNSATNTIELSPHGVYGYRDYVLLEELIHRYQNQAGYTERSLNKELEAKIGWINYLIRKGKSIGYSYRGQLGASYAQVESLAWIVGSKLYNANEDRHLYDQAIYSIKNVGTKYSNYPYFEDDNYRNFSCLFEIIQDCPTLF